MHQGFFVKHLYTEVFIISLNSFAYQSIEIHTELFNVMESLNPRSIDYGKDINIVHGYLLPPTILPNNFNGVGAFIIVDLPNTSYGLFTGDSFYSSGELAAAIQTTISHNHDIKIGIENIFVLYGVGMALTLSISEDELDEELAERGQAVIKEVKQVEEKLKLGDVL